jgi:two-component SAPR family response regulator
VYHIHKETVIKIGDTMVELKKALEILKRTYDVVDGKGYNLIYGDVYTDLKDVERLIEKEITRRK